MVFIDMIHNKTLYKCNTKQIQQQEITTREWRRTGEYSILIEGKQKITIEDEPLMSQSYAPYREKLFSLP